MGVAFEIARAALHLEDRDDPTKLAIAAGKIIELAKAGEINPDLLSEQALASLSTPPPRV
jgi:plasmid stability protein